MQINYHPNHGGGNWIAFLFGAVFNVAANVVDPGPASYLVHAIAGGLICLMFKIIGDLFTPLVRGMGQRLTRWLDSMID
ncbi:MAG: hypothetical protein ABIS36_23260 [Chryseolinea sp.]